MTMYRFRRLLAKGPTYLCRYLGKIPTYLGRARYLRLVTKPIVAPPRDPGGHG
jgi:hypothetical protein